MNRFGWFVNACSNQINEVFSEGDELNNEKKKSLFFIFFVILELRSGTCLTFKNFKRD